MADTTGGPRFLVCGRKRIPDARGDEAQDPHGGAAREAARPGDPERRQRGQGPGVSR